MQRKCLLCESPNKSNNVIDISWFVRVIPHCSFGAGPVFAGKVWIISMRGWSNSQKIPLKARELWLTTNTSIFYRAIRNDLLSVFNDLCGWCWTVKQTAAGVLVGRDEQVTNSIFLLLSRNSEILKRVTCSQTITPFIYLTLQIHDDNAAVILVWLNKRISHLSSTDSIKPFLQ